LGRRSLPAGDRKRRLKRHVKTCCPLRINRRIAWKVSVGGYDRTTGPCANGKDEQKGRDGARTLEGA
jgi:hypothetical protein